MVRVIIIGYMGAGKTTLGKALSKVGAELTVRIPALDKEAKMKVTSMKDKGSFAVWKATKATGPYDQKTFEVKARPSEKIADVRPGMSVILKK